MKKVYIVTRTIWHEGEFGYLELGDIQILAVCSSFNKAKNVVANIPVTTFECQFGSAEETCKIKSYEINGDVLPCMFAN